ncbi:MAG: BMP family ABC transporter substrate-binding protein, partial [Exiguobacterium sp.]
NVSQEALYKVEEYNNQILDGDFKVPSTDDEYKEYEASLK